MSGWAVAASIVGSLAGSGHTSSGPRLTGVRLGPCWRCPPMRWCSRLRMRPTYRIAFTRSDARQRTSPQRSTKGLGQPNCANCATCCSAPPGLPTAGAEWVSKSGRFAPHRPADSHRESHCHAPDHHRWVAGYSRAMDGGPGVCRGQRDLSATGRVAAQRHSPSDKAFRVSKPILL
jgi:hypothetical protein